MPQALRFHCYLVAEWHYHNSLSSKQTPRRGRQRGSPQLPLCPQIDVWLGRMQAEISCLRAAAGACLPQVQVWSAGRRSVIVPPTPPSNFSKNLINRILSCFPQTLNGMKTSTTVRHLADSFPSRSRLRRPGLSVVVVVVADYTSLRIIGLSVAGCLFITGIMIISCEYREGLTGNLACATCVPRISVTS